MKKKSKQTAAAPAFARFQPDAKTGLTAGQVVLRLQQNLVNHGSTIPTKSVGRIIFDNVFTLFNLIITLLGLAVLLVGSYRNLLFVGIMLINLLIGIVQEIRTKRVIDRLSILSATKVHAIRDGARVSIGVEEVVLDDVLEFTRGNQIVTDSTVLEGECDVNEALITGEPNPIHKKPGDEMLSGSFVVNGVCRARADHIGEENYVAVITNEAKRHKKVNSQMMQSLRKITRAVSVAIFPIGALLFMNQLSLDGNHFKNAVVSTTAALVGMIPEGLVLLTSVVLAVSVIRLSQHKVMVQELYCIEALARVDVLCLDKTGTITEGSMQLKETLPLGGHSESAVADALRRLIAVMEDDTPTFQAIAKTYGAESGAKADLVVPFSSETKWSGASFGEGESLLLGAPDILLRGQPAKLAETLERYAREGRVLLLAHAGESLSGRRLPQTLEPMALLLIQDTIRPDASDTLRFFAEQGVQLKVISGDNPITVSTIARRVGLAGAERYIDASTLQTEEEIAEAVETYTVFGRVSPNQKKQMVQALQKNQHTVAMTGDGVNDVLALKEADCSIAMAAGSDAARNVSQLVLMDSNFASMPRVVHEGRRSINNLQRSASLFLVKTIFSICLSLIFLFLPMPYPFHPIQLTLISALTIGFPSFVLALEPNNSRVQGSFLKNIVSKAVPAGLTIVFGIVAVALLSPYLDLPWEQVSTLCVYLTAFTGVLFIFKLCVPFTLLRKLLFGCICAGLLISVLFLPGFFSLSPVSLSLLPHIGISFVLCAAFFWILNRLSEKKTAPNA